MTVSVGFLVHVEHVDQVTVISRPSQKSLGCPLRRPQNVLVSSVDVSRTPSGRGGAGQMNLPGIIWGPVKTSWEGLSFHIGTPLGCPQGVLMSSVWTFPGRPHHVVGPDKWTCWGSFEDPVETSSGGLYVPMSTTLVCPQDVLALSGSLPPSLA